MCFSGPLDLRLQVPAYPNALADPVLELHGLGALLPSTQAATGERPSRGAALVIADGIEPHQRSRIGTG